MHAPEAFAKALRERPKADPARIDGNLMIIACDHPARGALGAGGGEQASYPFNGMTLRDISVDAAGNAGLLLVSGQIAQAVTLDKNLTVQSAAGVPSANRIVRAGNRFYLLTDASVECYTAAGEHQWSQSLAARPQALLAGSKQTLVFSGNTVQAVTQPEETSGSN